MLMKNFYLLDYRIWVTALLSGGLGMLLITLSSVFDKKPILLLAWPLATLFLIFMVAVPRWTIAGILMVRPLLDIVLNMTKVGNGQGSDGVGIGAVFNLTVVLLAVFLSFYYMNFPRGIFPVNCWIFFLLFMLMTALYSPYHNEGLRLCFDYLSYFALFLIPFLIIQHEGEFVFWLKVLGFSFVLPIMFANIDMLHGGHYFPDAGMRIMGTFTHPNILAFYLVLAFTFYFYILIAGFLDTRPVVAMIVKIIMLNILVLLIATKTRNAWVSVYMGFLIYGLLKDRKLLVILILLVPLCMAVPQVSSRISNLWNGESATDYHGVNSMEWRMQLWSVSWQKILERPIQGYGLSSFAPSTEIMFPTAKDMHAHNSYIEILFETGIFGLMSFIVIFFSPLCVFFQKMRSSASKTTAKVWAIMVGYIISYLLICSADNLSFYLTFNWYVWFFLGLMLVAAYRKYAVCLK